MISRSAFYLDCAAILSECGCKCGKCIEQMKSVFGRTRGVSTFYRESPGIVVEHDPDAISVEQLMDIFRSLPSFYENHFVPSVMENSEGKD